MQLISTPKLSIVDVIGKDAAKIANNLCTAPLMTLKPQEGCEAFFTDVRGKTLGHFCVYATDVGLRLIGAAGQFTAISAHFDRYTIREDANVQDHSDAMAGLLIETTTLRNLHPEIDFVQSPAPPFLAWRSWAINDLPNSAISAYQVPWLGWPPSHVLVVADATAIQSWLQHNHPQLQTIGADLANSAQFDALRVRACFPWYGIDLDEKNLPQELDRDAHSISFNKGCYLGQETVARLDALGQVQKKLVLWQVTSPTCPSPDTKLTVGETLVGRLTSVVPDDAPGKWLALGFARRSHFAPGSTAQCAELGPAVVQPPPSARL
jgi:folate-binding protein YgfZ